MRIYNGSNHMVRFFRINHENYRTITKERNENFIATGKAIYFLEIPRKIPLEAPHDNEDTKILFSFLPEWASYDVIICSRRYADFAIAHFSERYPEFVDRLYTVIPLFKSDGETPIGCIGIKKACEPMSTAMGYAEYFSGMNTSNAKNLVNIPLIAAEIAFRREDDGSHFDIKHLRHHDLQRMLSARGIDKFFNDFQPQETIFLCV